MPVPTNQNNGRGDGYRRLRTDFIVDKKFKAAWKSVVKHLSFRDKYNLYNTSTFFHYTLDLRTVSYF